MNYRGAINRKSLYFASLSVALISLPYSIKICHGALIFFLAFWATEGKWNEKSAILKKNVSVQLLIAFAMLQFLGMLNTENSSHGWFSLEKKIFFFLIPLAMATTYIRWEEKKIRLMLYLFVCSCFTGIILCLVHAARQTSLYGDSSILPPGIGYLEGSYFETFNPSMPATWLFFSYISLASGISLHPSYFSLYLAFCILFLLREILLNQNAFRFHSFLNGLVVFLFTIFIICLSSRIVVISLLLIYTMLALYILINRTYALNFKSSHKGTKPQRKRNGALESSWLSNELCVTPVINTNKKTTTVGIMVALIIAMVAVLYVNPVSHYRNIQEIAASDLTIKEKTDYKNSTEIRASLWWLGWRSYLKTNLFTGAGTGDVMDVMEKSARDYEITNILGSYDPHNQYLYTLIAHGCMGLAVLILYLAIPFFNAWSNHDYLFMGFIFLFASLCFTETALELQKGIVFFTMIYSLLVLHKPALQTEKINLKLSGAGS